MGVINGLISGVSASLLALKLHWMPLFVMLHLAFFVAHYAFASQAAHVGALFAAFCTMMLVSGARASTRVSSEPAGQPGIAGQGPGPGPRPCHEWGVGSRQQADARLNV